MSEESGTSPSWKGIFIGSCLECNRRGHNGRECSLHDEKPRPESLVVFGLLTLREELGKDVTHQFQARLEGDGKRNIEGKVMEECGSTSCYP